MLRSRYFLEVDQDSQGQNGAGSNEDQFSSKKFSAARIAESGGEGAGFFAELGDLALNIEIRKFRRPDGLTI